MLMPIPRSVWGARYPDGFGDRPMPIAEFWLHHSVTIAPDLLPPFTDDDAAVRLLEQIGQSRFGGGISYTRPVTPVGRLYEGHSLHRRGAHTKGHNTVGAAYCLIGNYDLMDPTDAQCLAIAQDMVDLHRSGKATRHTLNGGHRDTFGTACPGAKGYAAIPKINRLAEQLWRGEIVPAAGTYTRDDVKRLQRVLGLEDDGVWGPETERQAQAIRRALKAGSKPGVWDRVRYWRLRRSRPKSKQSSDSMRRAIQWALKVDVDGIWGPGTDAAWLAMRAQHRVTK
ncbi:peptidoglycan-binding domain-containing protein [Janibacter terrae]|uniref:peptidoglycan-binding domain-containing protein n=1 Tax=Janibacter terrae TaxID=103817 RepID=UPI0031F98050